MIYVEDQDFLSGVSGVRHGFFGRRGGVSTGVYDSLNIHPGSGDVPEHVQQNRERIAEEMGCRRIIF